jgi:hypothetical protein
MKLHSTQFYPASRYSLIGPNIPLSTLFSNTPYIQNIALQVIKIAGTYNYHYRYDLKG